MEIKNVINVNKKTCLLEHWCVYINLKPTALNRFQCYDAIKIIDVLFYYY